jgi:hypothetical protein
MKTKENKEIQSYKPYEVKPFVIVLKEGKTVYSRDVARRFDTYSFIRDVAAYDPSIFESKMTVRHTNAILDSLIANPKTSFQFPDAVVVDDEGKEHQVNVTIKWAGRKAS